MHNLAKVSSFGSFLVVQYWLIISGDTPILLAISMVVKPLDFISSAKRFFIISLILADICYTYDIYLVNDTLRCNVVDIFHTNKESVSLLNRAISLKIFFYITFYFYIC